MTQEDITTPVTTGPVTVGPAPVGGGREVALARAFADLAGGLVGDVDVPDLLHRLAEHCVGLLGASGCGIFLTDSTGGKLRLVAAFPGAAHVVEVLQLQDHQGPCVDCVHTGQPVRSEDLAADIARWPRWASAAVTRGIRSVYATPLRTPDTVIGALNLFGMDIDAASETDLLIVRALADVATLTLLQQRHTEHTTGLNTQLQAALSSRVAIEQAKGIIAHTLTVTMDEAFAVLRHTSRTTNTKLSLLADALITARITATDLLRPPPPGT